MAGASLLALLDDIATMLDDVAVMTKVAAQKTAGVLGDDLALNAQQVAGVRAERELPVVWAVAVGSLRNKAILVPAALVISLLAPWAITPLLMIGGLYLCFEGAEKLAHRFLHPAGAAETAEHAAQVHALLDEQVDMVAFEAEKIKGAIRTDFVLSAEIIVIALGTVADETFLRQVAVLIGIALVMTVGVYGFVAAIVKLDDLGLLLMRGRNAALVTLGRGLVSAAPRLMKVLTVVGTAAMFLVGGSIIGHGLPWLHHALQSFQPALDGGFAATVMHHAVPLVFDLVTGLVAGALAVLVVEGAGRVMPRRGGEASN